jgi:sulfatase modifying factor 1
VQGFSARLLSVPKIAGQRNLALHVILLWTNCSLPIVHYSLSIASLAGDRQINLFWIYCQNGGIMMTVRHFFISILIVATGCGSPIPTVPEQQEQGLRYDPSQTILIHEGNFLMGSNEWADPERPAHTVFLNPFRIDKYEVTNERYIFFLQDVSTLENAAGNELVDIDDNDLGIGFTDNGLEVLDPTKTNHPIIEVSWYGAASFCFWAGGRLPTESEWEKAARGVEGQHFPWSNEPLTGSLVTGWAIEGPTASVGTHDIDKSPYGVFDMGGNIAEWVNDWYTSNYYADSPEQNPLGPEEGTHRVARGGATSPYPQDMRATVRRRYRPGTTSRAIGFRCVYDVE